MEMSPYLSHLSISDAKNNFMSLCPYTNDTRIVAALLFPFLTYSLFRNMIPFRGKTETVRLQTQPINASPARLQRVLSQRLLMSDCGSNMHYKNGLNV